MSLDRTLALLSKAAYEGVAGILNLGYKKVHYVGDKETGTDCFVCVTKNGDIHVAVRGTEPSSGSDWITNLQFISDDFKGYKAHKGFVKATKSILEPLSDVLQDYRGRNLYITGHSLGGAIALLICVASNFRFKRLVTFGQPRTIERRASEALIGTEYVRYVNNSDIVPKVPFNWMTPYKDFGDMMYFDRKGRLHHNPSGTFRFFDGLGSFLNRIKDHSIDEYIKLVK